MPRAAEPLTRFGYGPRVLPDETTIKVIRLTDSADAEIADVHRLLASAERACGYAPLGEHKRLDLAAGGRPGSVGCLAMVGTRVIGYAHLTCDDDSKPRRCGLEVVVDPEQSDKGIEEELVKAALASVAEDGGGQVNLWAFHATEIDNERAARLGFTHGRDLLQMSVALPLKRTDSPRWPEGISLRTFRQGEDEEAWLGVNRRAFAGHPEQEGWGRDALEQRKAEPWFDPTGFLLASDDGADSVIAGFCWTKVHPENAGEIYVIGVDGAYRGKGLGRSLVLAGLTSLAERGMTTGILYVDASNAAAVGLYRSLGFEVHHIDRAYMIEIELPVG